MNPMHAPTYWNHLNDIIKNTQCLFVYRTKEGPQYVVGHVNDDGAFVSKNTDVRASDLLGWIPIPQSLHDQRIYPIQEFKFESNERQYRNSMDVGIARGWVDNRGFVVYTGKLYTSDGCIFRLVSLKQHTTHALVYMHEDDIVDPLYPTLLGGGSYALSLFKEPIYEFITKEEFIQRVGVPRKLLRNVSPDSPQVHERAPSIRIQRGDSTRCHKACTFNAYGDSDSCSLGVRIHDNNSFVRCSRCLAEYGG